MKVAIIGASGKTGTQLVRESLKRGYQVAAVCRDSSAKKLDAFAGRDEFTMMTAPVVSNEATLTRALAGCNAVVAILFAVRRLKATELVTSLASAAAANGVKRMVFTAGEVTAGLEEGEVYTFRQRFMLAVVPPLTWLSPYSVTDMIEASVMIRKQSDWEWTIMRAPRLHNKSAQGYRLCKIYEVNAAHSLSRRDYAACMLDSLGEPEHNRCTLTVVPANG